MQSSSVHSFATRTVHAGHISDPLTGAMLSPICQSTTFAQSGIGCDAGHTYSRASNPTVQSLELAVADLDGSAEAVCFATGMSATTALFFSLLRPGDAVVISDVVYGGTSRLLRELLAPFGVNAHFVDTADCAAVKAALTERTRLVFLETPANPTLKLADVEAVAALTRPRGILLAVDNTFLTPCLQNVRQLGADISLYSTTKYFDGHNATVGGAIGLDDPDLAEKLRWTRKVLGLNQKPFEAWLTLQGLQTLPLRMRRQAETAARLASWLDDHEGVARVFYPGLAGHPQHALAARQQESGGAIVAFEPEGGFDHARALVSRTQLITLAENLGAAQSLITHPASMTHADLDPDEAANLGITRGLIRLSVGLEDFDDLRRDLEQALGYEETGTLKTECAR